MRQLILELLPEAPPSLDNFVAGGNGEGLIFRKGEIVRKVPEADLVNELFQEIDQILEERKHASK